MKTKLLLETDATLYKAQRAPWSVPSFVLRNMLAELIERREADRHEWRCPECGAVTRARMADQ